LRKASPSVVSIQTGQTSSAGVFGAAGSGVVISDDGLVLTNAHVIESATTMQVTLSDGRSVSADLVGSLPNDDIALIKMRDPGPVTPAELGNSADVQVGDDVIAIGNALNLGGPPSVTEGIISAKDRTIQAGNKTLRNLMQTDAAINPGNSGGALVDGEGRLVGINTAIFSRSGGSMGIGFAIPVDIAREVMDALIRDGQMTRGWIGVQPRDLTPEFADSFQLPVREGVLVTGVLRDGPAAQAGLKPGDVVTAIGGVKISNTAQLLRAVGALKPPSIAVLAVQRGSDAMTLSVPVARRPPPKPRESDDAR
jgi:serine protease DegQ